MNQPQTDRLNDLHQRILGAEERLQELSQRLDNGIRNLVALAQAARQLSSRLEEMTSRIDTLGGSMAAINSTAEAASARSTALEVRVQSLEEQQFSGDVDLTAVEQRLTALEKRPDPPAAPPAAESPRPTAASSTTGTSGPAFTGDDDPSVRPLLASAMYIQRGEIAEAIAELEKAKQYSNNPKLDQALQLARRMLAEHAGPAGD